MTLRSLRDVRALAPIAVAAKRAGVEATLFGSVATRALLRDAANVRGATLFDLTEHLADIDLAHDGPAEATPILRRAMAELVPMAPWFRWSIVDRAGWGELEALRATNIGVPLRQLTLGTRADRNREDVDRLLARALEGEVEIVDQRAFSDSPRAGFDTEASAALLYLDVLTDVLETQHLARRPVGVSIDAAVHDLIARGIEQLSALSPDGRRRAVRRLWYRWSSFALRLSPEIVDYAARLFNLDKLVDFLRTEGYPAQLLREPAERPVFVSAYIDDDGYRLPLHGEVPGFRDPADALSSALGDIVDREPDDPAPPLQLEAGNKVIAAVRGVAVRPGESSSSDAAAPLAQEFLHIGLPLPAEALGDVDPALLSAIVIGHGGDGSAILPAFATVSLPTGPRDVDAPHHVDREPRRCTVRLNLAGLVEGVDRLDVFLVGAEVPE